jgi:hypothetical protein
MFLPEGHTPDPPQVIPLPGSRGWRDVSPHPDLFEDFADVYPQALSLGTRWGTGPTEPTYPTTATTIRRSSRTGPRPETGGDGKLCGGADAW